MCKLALVGVSLSYPGQLLVPDLAENNIVDTHSDISDGDSESDISDSESEDVLSQHPATVR